VVLGSIATRCCVPMMVYPAGPSRRAGSTFSRSWPPRRPPHATRRWPAVSRRERRTRKRDPHDSPAGTLTPRYVEVLQHLAKGWESPVAQTLMIREKTARAIWSTSTQFIALVVAQSGFGDHLLFPMVPTPRPYYSTCAL
jgi:hypothetical protein